MMLLGVCRIQIPKISQKTKNAPSPACPAQAKKGAVLSRLPGAVASVLQPRKGSGVASATQSKGSCLLHGVSDAARLALAHKK